MSIEEGMACRIPVNSNALAISYIGPNGALQPFFIKASSFLVLSMFSAPTEGFMAHQCGLVAEEWGALCCSLFSSACVLGGLGGYYTSFDPPLSSAASFLSMPRTPHIQSSVVGKIQRAINEFYRILK